MNAKTFRYIDKDKILPSLQMDRDYWCNIIDTCDNPDEAWAFIRYINNLIDSINDGFYDWQQGSE